MKNKTIITTNPSLHQYKIYSTLEAGLSLLGWETKSVRLWGMNLRGSHVGFNQQGAVLINSKIRPYPPANIPKSQQDRSRPLLLHKKQIDYLYGRASQGFFIIPTKAYWKNNKVKIEIALAKKLKKWQKKEKIKRRDLDRQAAQELNNLSSR